MKKLLATIGVHPTVIELDDHEIYALPPAAEEGSLVAPVLVALSLLLLFT
jgi:hydroxymethylglutaryl-CoA reductase